MRWIGSTNRAPIGVDLGGRTIKAVQLARSRGEWRMHAALVLPQPVPNHPLDGHTVRHLQTVMVRHGFIGDDIVLAAPIDQLVVDVLELPPRASGAPVEQIARMELARTAKLENEPFEMECWDLPAAARAGAATSMMAVALRHTDAARLLDPFDAEGLNVVAIDTPCLALARVCRPCEMPDTITPMLNIGWNSAVIGLLRDGVLVYRRVLRESGLGIVLRAICAEVDLADEEADYVLRHVGVGIAPSDGLSGMSQAPRIRELISRHIDEMVNEIQPAFHYAAHRYAETPIKALWLVGGGSTIGGLCEFLAARLSVEVKVLSPAGVVQCPAELAGRCGDGVLTMALGLAWHGAKE